MATPKQQDRIDRMYQAALDEFSQQGFHIASVDAIALRAGVSKATLYSHFKTKEKLFIEVFERGFDRIIDCSRQCSDIKEVGLEYSTRSRVGEFLHRIADSAETRLFFNCLTSDSEHVPNDLRGELSERFISMLLGEMSLSREAKEAGILFPDVDIDFFHHAVIGMLLQVLRFWWSQKKRMSIDKLTEQIANFMLFGLSGPNGFHRPHSDEQEARAKTITKTGTSSRKSGGASDAAAIDKATTSKRSSSVTPIIDRKISRKKP